MPAALLLAVILGILVKPAGVYAAEEATVTFGSNRYEKKKRGHFSGRRVSEG